MASENPYLGVIRLWAAAAWADGVVVKQERAALERLIAGAELTDGERSVALGFLDNKVELDKDGAKNMSAAAREGVYRAACKLASIDRHVADEERAFLGRLRGVLGLDEKTAKAIEQQAGV
jgi:uncharacterized membrane protein YebE (DUF533 family)